MCGRVSLAYSFENLFVLKQNLNREGKETFARSSGCIKGIPKTSLRALVSASHFSTKWSRSSSSRLHSVQIGSVSIFITQRCFAKIQWPVTIWIKGSGSGPEGSSTQTQTIPPVQSWSGFHHFFCLPTIDALPPSCPPPFGGGRINGSGHYSCRNWHGGFWTIKWCLRPFLGESIHHFVARVLFVGENPI
jgi:hypothetical protein